LRVIISVMIIIYY